MLTKRPRRPSLALMAILLLTTPVMAASLVSPAPSAPQAMASPISTPSSSGEARDSDDTDTPTPEPATSAGLPTPTASHGAVTPAIQPEKSARSTVLEHESTKSLPDSIVTKLPSRVNHVPDAGSSSAAVVHPPLQGRLDSGMQYILQPMTGSAVTAINLWFRAPSIGFGQVPQPSIAQLSAVAVAASTLPGRPSLSHLVQNYGGSIGIEVFPDSLKIGIIVPAAAASQTIAALATAYFTPTLEQTGYHKAMLDLGTQALLNRLDAFSSVSDILCSELFSDGPAHYAPLDGLTLNRLSPAAVAGFAQRAFRIDNALLVMTGAVDRHDLDSIDPNFHHADGPEEPIHSTIAPHLPTRTVESVIPAAGFGWVGPPISDDLSATAMDFIADYLFNDHYGTLTKKYAQREPDVELSAQFVTLHEPGVFLVMMMGEHSAKVSSQIENDVLQMRSPLNPEVFALAREAFLSHLEATTASAPGLAASLGWYTIEGNPLYAPGRLGEGGLYGRDVWSLTPEFVASTAQRYLSVAPARTRLLTIPGRKATL